MMLAHADSNALVDARNQSLADQQRFLIGACAALLPRAAQFAFVDLGDLDVFIHNLTPIVFLGSVVQIVILFGIGGIWAWLHANESNKMKIAEIGIVSPAVILALMNGTNAKNMVPITDSNVAQSHGTIGLNFASVAYAQEESAATQFVLGLPWQAPTRVHEIKQFGLPVESSAEQFVRGLTSQSPTRIYFVISSSHPTLEEANSALTTLEAQGLLSAQGFTAEVYEPSGGYPRYAVVIGAHLNVKDAQDLRQQAVAAGFPIEQVWRLGQ
jgi:hypothetical protein